MTDVLTPTQRRLNMMRIRARDTKPEILIRKGLHAEGFRFRLHRRNLPGRPDLVLARHRVCIFVNGCFWHGHHCEMFRMPVTRRDFWKNKITSNRKRDRRSVDTLLREGWRVLIVWECATRGTRRMLAKDLLKSCVRFIQDDDRTLELRSKP